MKAAGVALVLLLATAGAGCVATSTRTTSLLQAEGKVYDLVPVGEWTFERPSGAAVLRVEHADTIALRAHLSFEWGGEQFEPVWLAYRWPNGTLEQATESLDYDGSRDWNGDGVVYAGAGGQHVESPAVFHAAARLIETHVEVARSVPEVQLVLMWANQSSGVHLRLEALDGTQARVVAEAAELSVTRLQELGSARVGAAPVAAAHAPDTVRFAPAPERMLVGYVRTVHGGGAVGSIELRTDEGMTRHELTWEPKPGCAVCGTPQRSVFATAGTVELDVAFAGWSRFAGAYVVVAEMPVEMEPLLVEFHH